MSIHSLKMLVLTPLIASVSLLTAHNAAAQQSIGNVSWSPNGEKLTFYARWDGDSEIYVINADGSGLRQITDNDLTDTAPRFTRDGARILFASRARNPESLDIFVANLDTGAIDYVYGDTTSHETFPVEAPDGAISFTSYQVDDSSTMNIYLYDPKTTESQAMVTFDGMNTLVEWDPKGRQFYFAGNNSGRYTIYRADADGSNIEPLGLYTNPSEERYGAMRPTVSKDGNYLAFWGDEHGFEMHDHHGHVFDMKTRKEVVLPKQSWIFSFPSISPDGKNLAYAAAYNQGRAFSIYVQNLETGTQSVVWPPHPERPE